MPSKAQMYAEVATETAGRIIGSYQRWTDFLETAARLYKYPFHEQLMIYAQRPEATACASFEMWNETMRRYVKRGSKGIALIDPETERLRYVFDVSDTGTRENSRRLYLWEFNENEHFDAVSKALEQKYDVSGKNGIAEQLEVIAAQLTDEFWNAHQSDILSSVEDSYLSDYDDFDVNVSFHNAATVSATYMLLSRCGLDPKEYFTPEDYLSVFDFNTPEAVYALGSAISETSEEILRTVETAVKNYERERRAERIEHHANNLQSERGLSDPRPDGRIPDSSRQVRQNEEELSQNPPPDSLEQDDTSRQAERTSLGDRPISEPESRDDDVRDVSQSGSDREAESRESNAVDSNNEQPEVAGRGDNSQRDDLRLDEPSWEQISLFPTEEEQIAEIDSFDVSIPAAFSFSEDEINSILIHGGSERNARLKVVAEFEKQKPISEIAGFLTENYKGAAGFKSEQGDFSAKFDSDGIHLSRGRSVEKAAQTITWETAAERIEALLQEGKFASNVELAEAAHYEKEQTAESLWFMVRDLADEYKGIYFQTVREGKTGNFPNDVAQIVSGFENPDYIRTVLSEIQTFRQDYAVNRDILRFHHYNQDRIDRAVGDLLLPRIEFQTDLAEVKPYRGFITDDEINRVLKRPPVSNGDFRIYEYFKGDHTDKEKAAFLKNEYGTGGRYPGWEAYSSGFDFNSKGIRLEKSGCYDVQLPWTKVAKYIDKLVFKDEYLTPERQAEYDRRHSAAERTAEQVELSAPPFYADYTLIKEQHPDDIILYQVGDFFEMYGEDAEKAAELLGLRLAHRTFGDERAPMCGIPSYKLEENVEKLCESFGVTISAVGENGERASYSFRKHEAEKELQPEVSVNEPPRKAKFEQSDINELIIVWNGNPESKRAVYEYMLEHERERDTATWLANEYGADPSQPLLFTSPAVEEELKMPWAKVQRRIAQLIQSGEFMPETEREQAEQPAENPLQAHYSVGDTVYLDNTAFEITEIGLFDVQLLDPTLEYPVFRTESKERLETLLQNDERNAHLFAEQEQEQSAPDYTSETVAVYPAESNHLPFDVVVETLHFDEPEHTPPNPAAENFRITDDHLGEGGAKAKFRMNMEAINLLKELEFDGRQATPDEQAILSRYVGWGGLADAFDESKSNWANEFQELYAALTPEEYAAARASTLNAHYTSPTVIKAIYEAVENMGFKTGNILEPSMGVGNFFGLLPENMQSSKLYGVELDSLTGRIAKQLYPKADIKVAGFETTDRRDFFDLAVGNVPFGNYKVNDRAYNKLGFSIHDYFFAKTLDQVRAGGVIAFVTSRYTMDKQSPEVRKYIAERAELLGAIRLPNNAFKANAGTEVTSDIIFLQKRDRPIAIDEDWIHLGQTSDGFSVNSYFVDHPEMVLGTLVQDDMMYGDKKDIICKPIEGANLSDQLHEAIRHIGGIYREAELPDLGEDEQVTESIPADPNVRNYSYAIVDGEVYFRENSVMVKPDLNATAKERVKGLAQLRDCVHKLIDEQTDGYSDSEIKDTQQELNRIYDRFTAKFGLINTRPNQAAFSQDSAYYLLCSLEILDENKNLARKADIFSKRTIKPHEVVTSVDTAAEALALSVSEKACVDMQYMSELTGKDENTLASELRGVIFKDYARDYSGRYTYRTADDFLSGNVRQKLKYYESIADSTEGDKHQAVLDNIEALKAAQPKDLDASEIEVRLGATWIDKEYIRQFMFDTFEPPYYLRYKVEVNFSDVTAEWSISNKSAVADRNFSASMNYGTGRLNPYKILEDTLNLRDVRVYDTVKDTNGNDKRVLNEKETTLAQQKQQAIKDAFRDWIWKNPERREKLVTKYNELFNSTRPREYDGSHINFVGMNPEINLRDHQKNAIAHVLYGGNTLLAHEVGAGKTFEMAAAAMESKRLGLCRKSLFVVPNHLTEQWASEFLSRLVKIN